MVKHPDDSELVVCQCTKILKYGAFFKLIEYPEIEGFMHVSQVSSGWVKNINSFLRIGQTYVARVLNFDASKIELNLSMRNLTDSLKAKRLQQWRHDKRAKALLNVAADRIGVTPEEVWTKVAEPLLEEYESLYKAFEFMSLEKKPLLKLPKKWNDVLLELAANSIEVPKKTVKGTLTISCSGAEGVEVVKKVLVAAEEDAEEGTEVKTYSISAPKYAVSATAFDFKVAEDSLRSAAEAAEIVAKENKGCSFAFERA
ncbi:MAG: S1 RNA-binding domain-containing protein [Candidatus Diapherotrites archaeon]|nr:S1 RNA-binding domain-containing protein [Candidatus Diapherotrites archaeon]